MELVEVGEGGALARLPVAQELKPGQEAAQTLRHLVEELAAAFAKKPKPATMGHAAPLAAPTGVNQAKIAPTVLRIAVLAVHPIAVRLVVVVDGEFVAAIVPEPQKVVMMGAEEVAAAVVILFPRNIALNLIALHENSGE